MFVCKTCHLPSSGRNYSISSFCSHNCYLKATGRLPVYDGSIDIADRISIIDLKVIYNNLKRLIGVQVWTAIGISVLVCIGSIANIFQEGLITALWIFVGGHFVLAILIGLYSIYYSVMKKAFGAVAEVVGPGAALVIGAIVCGLDDMDPPFEDATGIGAIVGGPDVDYTSSFEGQNYTVGNLEEVEGYVRQNGTVVNDYVRTEADASLLNNLRPPH